jgi:acetyltransferase-like isoleucine patch superfamily enzyme
VLAVDKEMVRSLLETFDIPCTLVAKSGRNSLTPNITIIISSGPSNSKLKFIYPKIFEPVTVEEDVWTRSEAVILPGVTIGKCSIIGAGAIVTKDIAPYSVAVDSPAKISKKLTECKGILK